MTSVMSMDVRIQERLDRYKKRLYDELVNLIKELLAEASNLPEGATQMEINQRTRALVMVCLHSAVQIYIPMSAPGTIHTIVAQIELEERGLKHV